MNPSVLIEQTAQAFLDEPALYQSILTDMEQQLWEYYARLDQRLPMKAAFLVARSLRAATFAAVSHIVYTELVRLLWPRLQDQASLVTAVMPDAAQAILYDESDYVESYQGSCNMFMQTLTGWLQMVSVRVLDRLRQATDDPEAMLWRAHTLAQQRLGDAALHYLGEGHNPPDPYDNWVRASMPGNAEAVMGVLIHWAAMKTHMDSHQRLTVEDLASHARSQLDCLTWMAHTSRSLVVSCFHGPNSISKQFLRYEGRKLTDLSDFFPEYTSAVSLDESGLPRHWVRAGLQDGPWDRPGFCPAIFPLRSPRAEDRQIIVDLLAWYRRQYPEAQIIWTAAEDEGLVDRTTLALMLGICVAEETIYPVWPKVQLHTEG